MQSIKGVKFQFSIEEGNLELLLKRYSKAVNLFLEKIFLERVYSISLLNKFRKEICAKAKLTGYTSVLAMRSALAIYRSWKKNKRKELPKVEAKFIQLHQNDNCKLVENKLRITFERRRYVWLKLKVGKYQQMFLDLINQNKIKLGQLAVGKNFVVLSVKRDYLPYEYQGILALDINEQSIDGIIFKNNELKPIKWDLSRIYGLNQRYFGYKRKLQKKYPNRFTLWKKLPHNKNYRNRVKWHLDNMSKQITEFAEKERLMIVMENLKNIMKGINKKKIKLNTYNNKEQMMRTKSLSLLGRLNRANFRRIQFLIDYKGRWNNIPIQYVSPINTSRTCSICGHINGSLKEKKILICEDCGFKIARDLNASINILKIGMDSHGSGIRLPKIEDLKNQISEVALTKIA